MTHKHPFIRRTSAFFLYLTFFVMAASVTSCAVAATVLSANDGDTFRVQDAGAKYKVRLWAVDAPERGQPGCDAALDAVMDITASGDVKITRKGKSYDRIVAQVQTPKGDLAEILLANGLVLLDERYSKNVEYRAAQSNAKANKLGLWATEFTAPWVWRKSHSSRGKGCT